MTTIQSGLSAQHRLREQMLTSIIRNGDNEGPIRIGMLVGVGRFELPASCSQNKCSNLAELHPER